MDNILSKLVVTKIKKVSAEVVYDKDWKVSFSLNYLPKNELSALLGKFVKPAVGKKAKQGEQEIDTERLSNEILQVYVNGWKGVTYEWLSAQMPLDLSGVEDIKAEIAFSFDNLKVLSENVYEFDGWVLETIKDASNFRAVRKEDELKN